MGVKRRKIDCISAVAYNSSFRFLGFYIVKPVYRKQGYYGFKLWQQTLHHLEHHVIGLDGVIEQQENYRKSGFKLYYRTIRFVGEGGSLFPSQLIDLHTIPIKLTLKQTLTIFKTCPRACPKIANGLDF